MGPLSYLKSLFGVQSTSETPATEKLTPREATRLLTEEVTAGYRPTSPLANFYSGSAGTPSLARMLADVEAMLVHPRVSTTLDYYKGGIAGAKFVLQDASSPEVGKFALAELATFWQRGRQAVQRSYEYGRGGCEIVYSREDGAMRFASAHPVAPLDCRVLTRGSHYAGFRLRGSQPLGTINLWGASGWMPCKGLWFAHNPRYSRWYGWPRLYAAWRPWKRLAGKDGAEETVDGGVYRFAFAPPIGRYPAQDERVKGPDGSTSQWSNRDKMREMLEHMKAGGVVAFSSRRDESGNYVWDVDWPQGSLDVGGLLVYTDNLEKAISLGVGVPPELIEASEVGSGYSGRAIPLEVFYAGQQHNADALVEVWYGQIGEPLLRFNFGPGSWARITVEDLLKSRMQNLQQSQPQSQNPPEQPTRPPGQPVQMSTFREEEHPRADDGRFGQKSGSKKSSHDAQPNADASSPQSSSSSPDPDANRPSRPENRHKNEDGTAPLPPAKPFRAPPPKQGKKGEGMPSRPKGDKSQTKIGDLGEELAQKLGFRSILPEGQRSHRPGENEEKGSTIDLEYDHSGRAYELKLCNTTATEYRLKAKSKEKEGKQKFAELHDLTPHVLVGVRDVETGEIYFYAGREPGFHGSEVSEAKYDFLGSVMP